MFKNCAGDDEGVNAGAGGVFCSGIKDFFYYIEILEHMVYFPSPLEGEGAPAMAGAGEGQGDGGRGTGGMEMAVELIGRIRLICLIGLISRIRRMPPHP